MLAGTVTIRREFNELKCKLWAESQRSLTGLLNVSIFLRLPVWKLCVCDPKISTLKTDLVPSLTMPTSPFQNKSIHRLRFDLFPTWTYATSCECPKRLTMPWLHTFPCMIVPITGHLVSRAVFESSNRERNALFQILPQTFFKKMLRLGTRWIQAFSFCFVLTWHHQARWGPHRLQCWCFCPSPSAAVLIDWSSETPPTCSRRRLSGGC